MNLSVTPCCVMTNKNNKNVNFGINPKNKQLLYEAYDTVNLKRSDITREAKSLKQEILEAFCPSKPTSNKIKRDFCDSIATQQPKVTSSITNVFDSNNKLISRSIKIDDCVYRIKNNENSYLYQKTENGNNIEALFIKTSPNPLKSPLDRWYNKMLINAKGTVDQVFKNADKEIKKTQTIKPIEKYSQDGGISKEFLLPDGDILTKTYNNNGLLCKENIVADEITISRDSKGNFNVYFAPQNKQFIELETRVKPNEQISGAVILDKRAVSYI
ncbi:MAG: hypothetical protein MJ230_02490 [bacterium]|nr:hypothetical protein [bacterium]